MSTREDLLESKSNSTYDYRGSRQNPAKTDCSLGGRCGGDANNGRGIEESRRRRDGAASAKTRGGEEAATSDGEGRTVRGRGPNQPPAPADNYCRSTVSGMCDN